MSGISLHGDNRIHFFELARRQENEEEILIGRPDIGNYILLPTIGVDIIDMLKQGQTIQEVTLTLEAQFGEPVDVESFVLDLIVEYQFVHKVDEQVVNEPSNRKAHFARIPESLCKVFFNKWTMTAYFCIFASSLLLMLVDFRYFPSYLDIFTTTSVSLSFFTVVFTLTFFLFIHELAHLMAARSLGVGSRIQLSHRLYFLVAETDMSNIVLVEPKKRLTAYLAGIAWDGTFLGLSVWTTFLIDQGWLHASSYVHAYLRLLTFYFITGIGYQFAFFTRTDLYYVFATLFKCNNLFENTRLTVHKMFRKITPREEAELQAVDPHEQGVIWWYRWIYIFGYLFATCYFVAFSLPQLKEYIMRDVSTMRANPLRSVHFVDSLVFTVFALLPTSMVVVSWIRTWRARRNELKRRQELLGHSQSL